jgi:hypothetical protein
MTVSANIFIYLFIWRIFRPELVLKTLRDAVRILPLTCGHLFNSTLLNKYGQPRVGNSNTRRHKNTKQRAATPNTPGQVSRGH